MKNQFRSGETMSGFLGTRFKHTGFSRHVFVYQRPLNLRQAAYLFKPSRNVSITPLYTKPTKHLMDCEIHNEKHLQETLCVRSCNKHGPVIHESFVCKYKLAREYKYIREFRIPFPTDPYQLLGAALLQTHPSKCQDN